MYEEVFGTPNDKALTGIREFTINHLFAHIWSRPELSVRDRSLITIALLAAQGRDPQLREHITGALKRKADHRLSEAEVMEIMLHVAHYCGWPAGNGGQRVALDVFQTLTGTPTPNEKAPPILSEEEVQLQQLNEEIANEERKGTLAEPYLKALLAEDFIFRRAGGAIEKKLDYLKSLETVKDNPYERLDTYVETVTINGNSAVAEVTVIAKRKDMPAPGEFSNVRMFRKENDEWKLVTWVNTKVYDLI